MAASNNLGRQFDEHVTAYHASPRRNRSSISESGITPSADSFDSETKEMVTREGKPSVGAFFFPEKKHVARYTRGDAGLDIWKGSVPAQHVHQDPFIEDARYTDKPISEPERVGHTTSRGIHWHPEESCPICNS